MTPTQWVVQLFVQDQCRTHPHLCLQGKVSMNRRSSWSKPSKQLAPRVVSLSSPPLHRGHCCMPKQLKGTQRLMEHRDEFCEMEQNAHNHTPTLTCAAFSLKHLQQFNVAGIQVLPKVSQSVLYNQWKKQLGPQSKQGDTVARKNSPWKETQSRSSYDKEK